jgi:hypothetical protein
MAGDAGYTSGTSTSTEAAVSIHGHRAAERRNMEGSEIETLKTLNWIYV